MPQGGGRRRRALRAFGGMVAACGLRGACPALKWRTHMFTVPDPSDSKDEDENEARGWEDEGRERHGEEEAAEVLRICEAAQHSAMRVGEIVPLNLSQGTERG